MNNGNELGGILFKRKFSTCFFKNKRLLLGEMEFSKDFINTGDRGDKYPLIFSQGEFGETAGGGKYTFTSADAKAARLLGGFVPFACYEAVIDELDGGCGFVFSSDGTSAAVELLKNRNGELSVRLESGEKTETVKLGGSHSFPLGFSVVPRNARFDVYISSGFPELICTFDVPSFDGASYESFFQNASASVLLEGTVKLTGASFFMDSGISQADIRAVCYENGDVIFENGRVFFTASVRLREGGYQGVFSWVPGTDIFELTGALFFDAGDGMWASDVATSLKYDRRAQKWLLWVCSFSHGHIPGFAEFDGEPRFGRNVIDITLVDALPEDAEDEEFGGKRGDEDPDLIFDEERGKWLLAVCRVSKTNNRYRYVFFESDSPLGGFVPIGAGLPGSETGGSFVRFNGTLYFVCGNGFEEKSDYRIYRFGDFENPAKALFDYPDGGFRGWGTVVNIKAGTRQKLYWLTFDRHLGSDFNWSYGNLYCFEGFVK